MDLELTDTERMLRDTFRGYFTREIEPHVPAMEHGELLPYDLMRHMHRTLGLDALLASVGGKRARADVRDGGTTAAATAGANTAAAEATAFGLDTNVARYARTT